MKAKILVVEDEVIIATDIKDCLEKSGYNVPAVAAYGEQALEKVAELHPDLVLMDVMLKGDMNGIEAAEKILDNFNIPVVYLSAYSDQKTLQKAKTTQPFGYILKPFEETQLITTIEIAINRYQAEIAVLQALKKEKEMREIKSRFISMVSHEFRNPLSTILTSTELLSNHNHQLNASKRHEYINHIQNAVKHLNNLLNDVLVIGKAEEYKLEFNPAPLNLEEFCQNLAAEMQICASDKHQIIFKCQCRCTPPDKAKPQVKLPWFDEKLLRQILTNLLANAVKYSPQGGTVSFDLFCEKNEVIFRISDEGIGIPPADQENLFESFHRATNVGRIPGTGLGLSIVKHYVELHGGEITFASKVGVGTTFIVTLPFRDC
jgi:signal transduction histidine kinase